VAERITARFFNVLRLLNRSVPMIAVQLSAFRLGDADEIVIHPVTVLDVIEETGDPDVADVERVDRAYWEKKSTLVFLQAVDYIATLIRQGGIEPRITYNRGHIALGGTGYNFCWLHTRTAKNHCNVEIRLRGGNEQRDEVLTSLINAGIDASARQAELLTFNTTTSALAEHSDAIGSVLKQAGEAAGARG
jgi:hypothetical protein